MAKRLSDSRNAVGSRRPPLAAYELFHTIDLDEAREQVGRIYCPHRLELVRGHSLDAFQNAASVGDVRLSCLSYGGAVEIVPRPLETFYLVQIPLAGGAEIRAGSQSIVSTPSLATVLSPGEPIWMRWSAQSTQLDVYFDRGALERRLEAILGEPIREPLRFRLGMELGTEAGRGWLRLVSLFRDELEREGMLLREPLATAQLEDLLMTALLLVQPNTYSGQLHGTSAPVTPRSFRRILDHIDAHLDEPLRVSDLAHVGNVSIRSLEQSFRRNLGTTPTAYIRELRLQRSHADLVAADPLAGVSVSEVARTWGFTHLGRFADLYRRTYGVSPSQTLHS